jgi:hypothetical protein
MKTATPTRIQQGKTFEHHYMRFRIEGLTQEHPPRVQVVQLTDGGTPAGTTWRFTEKSVRLLLAGKNPRFREFCDLPEIVNDPARVVPANYSIASAGQADR